jgi:CheY-like chemotaxis protein
MEAKVVDLGGVVAAIEKMLRRLIGDDVTLAIALAPGPATVRVDPGRMEQVIVNLALNARHAMPRGGRLTLSTAPVAVRPDAPAGHREVPEGSWVLFSVEDTGEGMDAETQARVFEPFFSTRKPGEGTGLGLSTAYGFVRQSGGHIFVHSAPGHGTRFSIYLPLAAEEPAAAEIPPRTAPGRGSETVLLVEDEPEVRGVVSSLLLDLGYRVVAAASGREALALAARDGEPFDLLLTDVTMPEMSGRELAVRLRELRPSTRVLYMSGHQEELSPREAAVPGFLQKPFSAEELAHAVRTVLDGPP